MIRYIIVAGNPAISTSDNGMLSEDSLRMLTQKKGLTKDESDNLECTIKIKYSTVDALKEIAYRNNWGTYDSAILHLIKAYNKAQSSSSQQG